MRELCAACYFEITVTTIVNTGGSQVNHERLSVSSRPCDYTQRHICRTECILRITNDQAEQSRWDSVKFEATLFISESSSDQAMIFFRE